MAEITLDIRTTLDNEELHLDGEPLETVAQIIAEAIEDHGADARFSLDYDEDGTRTVVLYYRNETPNEAAEREASQKRAENIEREMLRELAAKYPDEIKGIL